MEVLINPFLHPFPVKLLPFKNVPNPWDNQSTYLFCHSLLAICLGGNVRFFTRAHLTLLVSSFPGSVTFCFHFTISILVYRNLAVYLFLSHTHYIYIYIMYTYIFSHYKNVKVTNHMRDKLPFYPSFLPSSQNQHH